MDMEHYGSIKDAGRKFDLGFWQAQGDAAIFEAAEDLIRDRLLLKHGQVGELCMDKTVEVYRRIRAGKDCNED